jgi:lipoprotein-anchoring transpeptidase ErfK/SrfK
LKFEGRLLPRIAVLALAVRLATHGLAPAAAHPLRPKNGVVISLSQQRLYEYHGGRLTHVLRVSTASGDLYYSKRLQRRVRSRTPCGTFRIRDKRRGWKRSQYGRLYYPSYYDRAGRAIHGYRDLRPHHSHGCVRIPMRAARGFYHRNPIGTPVYIE